jgi:hypothetical protein
MFSVHRLSGTIADGEHNNQNENRRRKKHDKNRECDDQQIDFGAVGGGLYRPKGKKVVHVFLLPLLCRSRQNAWPSAKPPRTTVT